MVSKSCIHVESIRLMSKEARPAKNYAGGVRGGAPQYPMTLHTGNRTTTKSYYKRSIALYTVCCSNLPTFSSTGRRTSAVLMSLQVWEGRGTYGGTKRGRDHHLWRLLLNLALESGSASIRDRLSCQARTVPLTNKCARCHGGGKAASFTF